MKNQTTVRESYSFSCYSGMTGVSREDPRYAEAVKDEESSLCSCCRCDSWNEHENTTVRDDQHPNNKNRTRSRQNRKRRQRKNGFLWSCTILLLSSSVSSNGGVHGAIRKANGGGGNAASAAVGDEDRSSITKTHAEQIMKAPAPPPRRNNKNHNTTRPLPKDEKEFFNWCQQVMGVETLLTIETFEYPDFQRVYTEQLEDEWYYFSSDYDDTHDDDDDDTFFQSPSECDFETIPVRGLAASRDIQKGEVVISIPFHAMISISTTIDHDPVLSRFLGPEARSKLGWDSDDDSSAAYYELPLLSFAILYHYRLGRSSPLYHYIEILKSTATNTNENNNNNNNNNNKNIHETTTIPFLWNRTKLKQDATEGVQRISMGIKRDVREMYDTVIQVLIHQHPEVFGKDVAINEENGEWIYSYSMFQWAFAMVNSRHWHLPIQDLDPTSVLAAASHGGSSKTQKNRQAANNRKPVPPSPSSSNSKRVHHVISPTSSSQLPPAEQPTDEFVSEQNEELLAEEEASGDDDVDPERKNDRKEAGDSMTNDDTTDQQRREKVVASHSFLAPLADLLNFGPPCTRGMYNTDNRTFDIIATCSYQKGQEVTFWYSDDCADVIIANYGFTHPMVPKCLSTEDWKIRSDLWRQHAEQLEEQLVASYDEIDRLDLELHRVQSILEKCGNDCAGSGSHHTNGHDSGVRGGHHHDNDDETPDYRHRIRRDSSQRHTKKSDLGL